MEVTAVQSTITNAMNLYYSWLVSLIGPKGSDKIALLSSIVTHDIVAEAPLYTTYVFRQFADRTISISPEDFGAGNTNDRFSRIYNQIISVAGAALYDTITLTPKQENAINKADGDITTAIGNIAATRGKAQSDWLTFAAQSGFQQGTPQWDLERAKFYQPYIAVLKDERQKITRAQATKLSIRLTAVRKDPAAAELCTIYERCQAQDNIQALPTDETIETKYGLDAIKIAEAADSGLFAFESELGILPSGSLTRILTLTGNRGVTFSVGDVETHNHDTEWHASASASWDIFQHASVSGQSEQHFRQSLTHLDKIEISCAYLGEYWLNRRDWFSSNILQNKYVLEVFKSDKRSAALLALCISAMIIVRGLQVKYYFKDEVDTTIWSSYNFKAGGGFSVFGVDLNKAEGGTSGSSWDHVVNTVEKSVTFFDSDNLCRLIALRASTILPGVSLEEIGLESKFLEDSVLGRVLIDNWKSGKLPYGLKPAVDANGKFVLAAPKSEGHGVDEVDAV